jgi:hypothetical protein
MGPTYDVPYLLRNDGLCDEKESTGYEVGGSHPVVVAVVVEEVCVGLQEQSPPSQPPSLHALLHRFISSPLSITSLPCASLGAHAQEYQALPYESAL